MYEKLAFNITRSAEILKQTPSTLAHLLRGLSSEWTESSGDRANWSPFDVVGHLTHCEETDWVPRAEVILAQGQDRTFVPFDRFAQFENSGGKTLDDLLTEFACIRNVNIEKLLSWQLTPEKLALTGIHDDFGEVTLEQLLSTWVVHDLTHIQQIVRYLAGKYSENVGPWKTYLSILS